MIPYSPLEWQGIEWDTRPGLLSFPRGSLLKIEYALKNLVCRHSISPRDLEHMSGQLQLASLVGPVGWALLKSLIDTIRSQAHVGFRDLRVPFTLLLQAFLFRFIYD